MSVTFSCIRIANMQQTNLYLIPEGDTKQAWATLCCESEDLPAHFQSYQLIEMVTVGWAAGSRSRCRKMPISMALPYLNKLHAGKWISDDEYDRAWGATLQLLRKIHHPLVAEWETLPYQFIPLFPVVK